MHIRLPDAQPARAARGARLRLGFLLLVPLLAGVLGPPSAAADDLSVAVAQRKAIAAKIQAQRRQVAQLSASQERVAAAIASARKKLNGINANLSEVQQDVATLRANISLVRASFGNLVDQLAQIDRQLGVLQAEERRRQAALVERKELLAERVRQAYATDRVTLLETLLSADSFTDALAQVGYLLDVGLQDEALARQIVEDIRGLSALHQEILGTRAETEVLRDEIAARKVTLDGQLVELKDAEARLSDFRKKAAAALADERAEYTRLAENKQALAAAIAKSSAARESLTDRIDSIVARKKKEREALAASGADFGSIPSRYSGTLIWPMGGYVSQEYGCTDFAWYPPRGGCAHFHSGIDIVAPYGTPVRAAGSGEVLYVGWNYADGYDPAWIVVIAHADNMQTWYAHLQPTYPVRTGQWVLQGQIIGYEGNTGRSTGAHLHWMVRVDGEFLNPRLFV
ncbi:MAG: hypothetical protein FJ038_13705 [Chloroflexi bacterium]|nr:hypothetical protein [Chloroflexota bacterium]